MPVVPPHLRAEVRPKCPVCDHPMTLLFFSAVCDVCTGHKPATAESGYAVFRGAMDGEVYAEYVFRSRQAAENWRAFRDLDHVPIAVVQSAEPFEWQAFGSASGGVETTARRYLIYPDRDYPAGPYRAHVVG